MYCARIGKDITHGECTDTILGTRSSSLFAACYACDAGKQLKASAKNFVSLVAGKEEKPQEAIMAVETKKYTIPELATLCKVKKHTIYDARKAASAGRPSTSGNAGHVEAVMRKNGITWDMVTSIAAADFDVSMNLPDAQPVSVPDGGDHSIPESGMPEAVEPAAPSSDVRKLRGLGTDFDADNAAPKPAPGAATPKPAPPTINQDFEDAIREMEEELYAAPPDSICNSILFGQRNDLLGASMRAAPYEALVAEIQRRTPRAKIIIE